MRTSLRATVVVAATALMVLAGTLGARDASTAEIDRGPHSHPDELSLVTYAHGRELLVDPGAYSYSSDPRSDWLR
ncbi:heparinase II/III family protein [Kribbella sp. C-35]|uniref:heparinase II/III domain-containing protein n=1 Tax=Kribbella sp. C-35 TaxID=2789276 RepID=UPI003979D167